MPECKNNTIEIKLGSDAIFNMVYKDANGDPISLAGYTIFMNFIHPKNGSIIIATSIGKGITVLETLASGSVPAQHVGEYIVNAGNTINWPLGNMPVDILYEVFGKRQHTENMILDLTPGLTQVPTSISN